MAASTDTSSLCSVLIEVLLVPPLFAFVVASVACVAHHTAGGQVTSATYYLMVGGVATLPVAMMSLLRFGWHKRLRDRFAARYKQSLLAAVDGSRRSFMICDFRGFTLLLSCILGTACFASVSCFWDVIDGSPLDPPERYWLSGAYIGLVQAIIGFRMAESDQRKELKANASP